MIVGWSLIALFTALPWLRINGKPPILLDLMTRHFTFFGTTFLPTETLLLALLMLSIFITIFLLTALYGRVWCGWGCPQTVYMEFVYRPIERIVLGHAYGRRTGVPAVRRVLLWAIYLVVSAHLANTFLAYFVGTDRLVGWTLHSPTEHPVAFVVFVVTVAAMMFDFTFFREQMCTIACPYGRFQSALLDRDSLIVGYNRERGEPRATAAQKREALAQGAPVGDCIACTKCVQVCPTGIDIREGLQLECVACAQCIDACDDVMDKIGRPRGLIGYTTQRAQQGGHRKGPRYRLWIYPVLLGVTVTGLVTQLAQRPPALIEQSRLVGANFTATGDGMVSSPARLLIENHTADAQTYSVISDGDVTVAGDAVQVMIPAADAGRVDFSVLSPANSFVRGSREVSVLVIDSSGFSKKVPIVISGPFTMGGGK